MRKSLTLFSLLLLFTVSVFMSASFVPLVHAATGLVCLQDPSSPAASSSNPCPASAPTFNGPIPGAGQVPPTQLRVGVYVKGSDGLNGFDITLVSNHTVIKPAGVDFSGTVVPGSPTVVEECFGNVSMAGPRCAPYDSPDTLHFALAGSFGLLTAPPTTGLLFIAIYNISATAATSGVSIAFQTSSAFCSGHDSSVPPFCVNIGNGSGTPDVETVQAAAFNNHTPPPWVAISTTTSSLTFFSGGNLGSQATFVSTAENGWPGVSSDSISFVAKSSPIGLVATFSPPACATGGASCSVLMSLNGPAGNYSLAVFGKYVLTDPNFGSQTTTLGVPFIMQVVVRDFGLTATPTSLSFNAGASPTINIGLSSLNGFVGTITLSTGCSSFLTPTYGGLGGGDRFYTLAPFGSCPFLSLSTTSVTLSFGGSATSVLTILPSNGPGNYTIFVYADSASGRHTVTVTLIINDFTVIVSPSSANVDVSAIGGTSTVRLTSLVKFAGSVALSAAVSPSGLSVSVSPGTVSLSAGGAASSTLTYSAPAGTPTGTYTITVTATSGGVSHSANVVVFVHPAGFVNPLFQFITDHQPSIALGVGLLGFIVPSMFVTMKRRSSPATPTLRMSSRIHARANFAKTREWMVTCNTLGGVRIAHLTDQSP